MGKSKWECTLEKTHWPSVQNDQWGLILSLLCNEEKAVTLTDATLIIKFESPHDNQECKIHFSAFLPSKEKMHLIVPLHEQFFIKGPYTASVSLKTKEQDSPELLINKQAIKPHPPLQAEMINTHKHFPLLKNNAKYLTLFDKYKKETQSKSGYGAISGTDVDAIIQRSNAISPKAQEVDSLLRQTTQPKLNIQTSILKSKATLKVTPTNLELKVYLTNPHGEKKSWVIYSCKDDPLYEGVQCHFPEMVFINIKEGTQVIYQEIVPLPLSLCLEPHKSCSFSYIIPYRSQKSQSIYHAELQFIGHPFGYSKTETLP